MVQWFINVKQMVVFVEAAAFNDPLLVDTPAFTRVQVGSPIQIHSDFSMFTHSTIYWPFEINADCIYVVGNGGCTTAAH